MKLRLRDPHARFRPLQDPDPSHQNHPDTDKAAYHSHFRVEHTTHCSPHRSHRQDNMRIHLILATTYSWTLFSQRMKSRRLAGSGSGVLYKPWPAWPSMTGKPEISPSAADISALPTSM